MTDRLLAPPASRNCLDLEALAAVPAEPGALAAGHALRRGLENPVNRELIVRETRAEALALLIAAGHEADTVETLWRTLPDHVFLRLDAEQLLWTKAAAVARPAPRVVTRSLADKGISELFVHAPDFDGLFAVITRELDFMHLNVLAARVLTTTESMNWDVFQIMDANNRPLNSSDAARLEAALAAPLAQLSVRPLPPREKQKEWEAWRDQLVGQIQSDAGRCDLRTWGLLQARTGDYIKQPFNDAATRP